MCPLCWVFSLSSSREEQQAWAGRGGPGLRRHTGPQPALWPGIRSVCSAIISP